MCFCRATYLYHCLLSVRIRQPFKKLYDLEQFTVLLALLKYFVSFMSSVIVSVFVLGSKGHCRECVSTDCRKLSVNFSQDFGSFYQLQTQNLGSFTPSMLLAVSIEPLTSDSEENKWMLMFKHLSNPSWCTQSDSKESDPCRGRRISCPEPAWQGRSLDKQGISATWSRFSSL